MEKECCPRFHPKIWDGKTFVWKSKPFIKESMFTFFHIPFPPSIGRNIGKMMSLAEKAKKISANKNKLLMLFHDPSLFKSEILISVIGNVYGANNVHLSGTFISKVYEGDFSSVPKFIKQVNEELKRKEKWPRIIISIMHIVLSVQRNMEIII